MLKEIAAQGEHCSSLPSRLRISRKHPNPEGTALGYLERKTKTKLHPDFIRKPRGIVLIYFIYIKTYILIQVFAFVFVFSAFK